MADTASLHTEYEYIAKGYTGFNLSEIKGMSPRERGFWVSMNAWRKEQG